ncbi:hypothetical protein APHAL10511_004334 [Amanita phalloides]|nr:hypothetical protein APHAL10511_004334 [Amanita phalloides]
MQLCPPSSPPSRGATPCSASPGPSLSASSNGFVLPPDSASDPNADIDPQIVEALKSKDRIFVLKLGETMENLIREPLTVRMDVTAATSYQRMLVHRCSSFYKTALEVDQITKAFSISLTPDSRIPERRISELVPAEPTPQPAIKIMQRTPQDRKPKSQANSVAGDDPDLSDPEPSETGSLGGKSTSTSGHTKKRPTIEEREAAYKVARSRIFMGFEEKEKGNLNASSSSLSLTSSSAGAGSSIGDLDESSSPATESEWSTSNMRENKKDLRRGSGASSSRNGRPNFNGSTGVRDSGASSPSFKYASIYDSPSATYYDPHGPYPEPLNPGYHPPQYPAPYPPPGHPPHVPLTHPYPYYQQYNTYPPLLQPQHHPIDGMPPINGDMYANPMGPGNNFSWQIPNQPQPPPHMQHPQLHSQPHSSPNLMMNAPPLMPYSLPPYPYPMPGYYPPPPGQMAKPYPNPPPMPMYDMSRPPNGAVGPPITGRPGVNSSPNNNGRNLRGPPAPSMNGTSKGRSAPTAPMRSGWSFGPGVGMGGYVAPPHSSGDVVGPRLSSSRRQSGNGSSSGYSRTSSINDDVSSTASSSTTSSSSRRTFGSTTTSQHPLPPRPDWAVGMTPSSNPPHGRHHHDHLTRPMPSVNTLRNNNMVPTNMPLGPTALPPLHSTDFPPLTVAAAPGGHPPNTTGAWGGSNIRSTLVLNQAQQQHPLASSVHMHHFDDSDRGFERPPPKSAELYNHKSGKRCPTNNPGGISRLQDGEMDQRLQNHSFAEQIAAMTIAESVAAEQSSATLIVPT